NNSTQTRNSAISVNGRGMLQAPSERDIVVEIIRRRGETATLIAGIAATRRASTTGIIIAGLAFIAAETVVLVAVVIAAAIVVVATTAATAVEHLHFAGDDFRGVAVLAILPLPFAGAQAAFDVHLRAFFQVFAGDFTEAVEEHHAVPFGALLHLPGLFVFPAFAGGDVDVGHRTAAGQKTGFRVRA